MGTQWLTHLKPWAAPCPSWGQHPCCYPGPLLQRQQRPLQHRANPLLQHLHLPSGLHPAPPQLLLTWQRCWAPPPLQLARQTAVNVPLLAPQRWRLQALLKSRSQRTAGSRPPPRCLQAKGLHERHKGCTCTGVS